MRVTQQMLFNRYIYNLNSSLTSLMDLNVQTQTQKRINKPSDDPTGMSRVLSHRDTIQSLDQYKKNIATAKGWLNSSDETLMQVSTLLTRAKELATQAATGTVDGNNREQISYELRSLFDQFVSLANTKFEGNTIYSGHKTDQPAFKKTTWLTTNDDKFGKSVDFTVKGSCNSTVLVQFVDKSGTVKVGEDMNLSNAGVRYSVDGGKTWLKDGSITFSGGKGTLHLPKSGTSVDFHSDAVVKNNDPDNPEVADGTWLWLRPSAQYVGDDKDQAPLVDKLGKGSDKVSAQASGSFLHSNVTVRIDNDSEVGMDEDIRYSYSLDGGISWVKGNVAQADTSANTAVLGIANGGVLSLKSNGSNRLQPGQQFVIRPRSADIDVDISSSERVTVNNVGKDIFGGLYMDPEKVMAANGKILTMGSSNAGRVFHSNGGAKMGISIQGKDEPSQNLFEVMGNLVAFAETNNQTGVQQALANLKLTQEKIMDKVADVGGRINRLKVGETIVDGLTLNEKSLVSSIEDADISELMTQLAQQRIVYESVLRSTSMIMQLNLGKFI